MAALKGPAYKRFLRRYSSPKVLPHTASANKAIERDHLTRRADGLYTLTDGGRDRAGLPKLETGP